jgi:hypothetical protein
MLARKQNRRGLRRSILRRPQSRIRANHARQTRADHVTRFLETIKTGLECLAILAAAVWALYHFDTFERGETKTNFNGTAALKLNRWLHTSECLFDFEVAVDNVGKQTRKLDHIKYTICETRPPKEEHIGTTGAREFSGDCVHPPAVVIPQPDFIMGQTGEVHPGEKKQTVYSFVAPADEWPWSVTAIGYLDRAEKDVLFEGSDWAFCTTPEKE